MYTVICFENYIRKGERFSAGCYRSCGFEFACTSSHLCILDSTVLEEPPSNHKQGSPSQDRWPPSRGSVHLCRCMLCSGQVTRKCPPHRVYHHGGIQLEGQLKDEQKKSQWLLRIKQFALKDDEYSYDIRAMFSSVFSLMDNKPLPREFCLSNSAQCRQGQHQMLSWFQYIFFPSNYWALSISGFITVNNSRAFSLSD